MRRRVVLLTGLLALTACGGVAGADAPARLRVDVLATLPHDRSAFTQGLELADGVLYEGTGRVGASSLREVDPATGAVRRRAELPPPLFGEGVTVVGDRIWQLTWREGVAVQWDRASLTEVRRVGYAGEGWGLCFDGSRLVMSDGGARLAFRDPTTFEPTGQVVVRRGGEEQTRLNELECAAGAVWANVWGSDEIVRIDPASGRVTGVADASGLLPAHERAGADVLNGVAAVRGTDQFLVTGKNWPSMFRVRFVPVD
ncbi:Glutamine cyclotransferase [Streptoalloteichus tenebrarius]|uniref:Glutamine cyclotransferase n=1 Tax=Streptoalloteichus tenebrarius (strain ATCC 17920 / DSM 40477 / JCM 4838 / CBS 697.72 / NBRC 16177 / NCIMB 11028 / NRRL B-12390 / A12253. 1 / ISP 5477) TaxID=1933 RepID=A0ABT1HVI8_STRSD|nr:glutaminyl-peptide cyclotransferase [Streptoalloteichus tenebrarius]MCP2259523.1 Glutamine cyclotransferase [Streptoalloteichus tenebrarius]